MGYIVNKYNEFNINEVRDYKELPCCNLRLVEERRFLSNEIIDDEIKVARLVHEELCGCDRENTFIVAMDDYKRPICAIRLSIGSVDSAHIEVRDCMKALLLTNCTKFILLHNHISYDIRPSNSDVLITQKIAEASKYLGLEFSDHYVCGLDPKRRTSFAHRIEINDDEIDKLISRNKENYTEDRVTYKTTTSEQKATNIEMQKFISDAIKNNKNNKAPFKRLFFR